ncbi:MAG TPA: hypothetical protein VL979_12095 [Solirubrobacteraceae bacterium]|nr:hypothetical protein [Solirubrobacteraceae bacterium]
MGLLDEAIREHLELKRRGGADPSEVAREESEALAPPAASEPAAPEPAGDEPASGEPARVQTAGAELAPTGQETQELDMQAVIDEQDQFEWELPGQERMPLE